MRIRIHFYWFLQCKAWNGTRINCRQCFRVCVYCTLAYVSELFVNRQNLFNWKKQKKLRIYGVACHLLAVAYLVFRKGSLSLPFLSLPTFSFIPIPFSEPAFPRASSGCGSGSITLWKFSKFMRFNASWCILSRTNLWLFREHIFGQRWGGVAGCPLNTPLVVGSSGKALEGVVTRASPPEAKVCSKCWRTERNEIREIRGTRNNLTISSECRVRYSLRQPTTGSGGASSTENVKPRL